MSRLSGIRNVKFELLDTKLVFGANEEPVYKQDYKQLQMITLQTVECQ